MTLFDLLSTMPPKEYIIITDLEKKPGKCMSNRMKIGNIGMERLRNIGGKDVYQVGWSESQHCFYVSVGDKRYVKTELAVWHVVDTRLKQLGLMDRVRKGITEGWE